jgi:hypothetical protein
VEKGANPLTNAAALDPFPKRGQQDMVIGVCGRYVWTPRRRRMTYDRRRPGGATKILVYLMEKSAALDTNDIGLTAWTTAISNHNMAYQLVPHSARCKYDIVTDDGNGNTALYTRYQPDFGHWSDVIDLNAKN